VFDYSGSTEGLLNYQVFNLNSLFGLNDGTILAREYWSGLGTLQGVFSYYYEDFDSQGNLVTKTGSFRSHLNAWGMYGSQSLSPGGEAYWPVFWAGDPDLVASEAYFANYTQMTLMNAYSFVRFEGLPTIPRSLGPLSSGTYDDYNAAAAAAAAATSAASANYLSTLRGLEAAPLASSVRIVAENMDSGHPPGTFRLVYTPDVTTALTLGDLIQTDPYDEGNAYVTTLSPTSSLFGIEDVTVILTGYDDALTDIYGGFAARMLRVEAGAGDDTITVTGDRNGPGGNSTFGSAPLNMVINGGEGNDGITVLVTGTATIDGGEGNDTIMGQALANGPPAYFEVIGGAGDDYIVGIDDGANLLLGEDGDDVLTGGFDADDTIHGGAGNDNMGLGSWWDSFNSRAIYSSVAGFLDGGTGNDSISGANGDDTILGGAGDDYILGIGGNNLLDAGPGNDLVYGADGSDTLIGGPGNDTIYGGWGNDRAVLGVASTAVNVAAASSRLTLTSADGVDVVADDVEFFQFTDRTLTYAETALLRYDFVVRGTDAAENIIGSGLAERIEGFGGNDWITPGAGSDTVEGGDGVDMVSFVDAVQRVVVDLAAGTAISGADTKILRGIENVTGSIFGDLITGDEGANLIRALGDYDWIVGSGGQDTIDGGNGRDTVAYSGASSGVWVTLLGGTGNVGQANGDRFTSIENLTGSSFGDRLTGDNDRNMLRGLAGDDFIFGNGGNDTIDGGAGRDFLSGGNGNDRITGGRGNDTIDGGFGWDAALYSGNRADYDVQANADGSTSVFHSRGTREDGIDLLINVEVLEFVDGRLFL
jgi:Ca2+-binding RTX toxin-like protein